MSRVLCWYSDGAASAVALKMTKEKYGDVLALYCDTRSEHPDNKRFRAEVEAWVGCKVQVLTNPDYSSVNDVISKTRWMRGESGARCTVELKKVPRLRFQEPDDKHIFGYTYEEGVRIARLMATNWDLRIECPLFSAKLKKQNCLDILHEVGIEIPMMYRLGFDNNNCIGCVKAEGPDYWNRIRAHFPAVFAQRAKQERELGYALTRHRKKPVYLDELDPALKTKSKKKLNCDFLCGMEDPQND